MKSKIQHLIKHFETCKYKAFNNVQLSREDERTWLTSYYRGCLDTYVEIIFELKKLEEKCPKEK